MKICCNVCYLEKLAIWINFSQFADIPLDQTLNKKYVETNVSQASSECEDFTSFSAHHRPGRLRSPDAANQQPKESDLTF